MRTQAPPSQSADYYNLIPEHYHRLVQSMVRATILSERISAGTPIDAAIKSVMRTAANGNVTFTQLYELVYALLAPYRGDATDDMIVLFSITFGQCVIASDALNAIKNKLILGIARTGCAVGDPFDMEVRGWGAN